MNSELLNNILLVLGGILCGILFNTGITQLRAWRKQKKLDAIRPEIIDLGFDPNNPMNLNAGCPVRRGEVDENGFIRLW